MARSQPGGEALGGGGGVREWCGEDACGDAGRADAAKEGIDPDAGPGLELTPEQASTHTWKPDAEMWARIKRLSVKGPATVRIMEPCGWRGREAGDGF